jgi:site-specific DNA-cytosine methylase
VRVLVACEFSGVVRDAFTRRGHFAISVDLLPSERPGPHWQGDVLVFLQQHAQQFDLMIAHPPCTHLSVSGARHFHRKQKEQTEALDFVKALMLADVPRIAVENPVSIISSRIRPADQVIHPWQYGHPEQKSTCLWLKNLPLLKPTSIVWDQMQELPKAQRERVLWMGRGKGHERSVTFQGFADAMADQWGTASDVQLPLLEVI